MGAVSHPHRIRCRLSAILMAQSSGFAIQKLDGTLNDATFVPVTPANQCLNLFVQNGSDQDLYLRSNEEDAASEVPIAAGSGFAVATGPVVGGGVRFPSGPPAAFLKAGAGGDGTGVYLVWS